MWKGGECTCSSWCVESSGILFPWRVQGLHKLQHCNSSGGHFSWKHHLNSIPVAEGLLVQKCDDADFRTTVHRRKSILRCKSKETPSRLRWLPHSHSENDSSKNNHDGNNFNDRKPPLSPLRLLDPPIQSPNLRPSFHNPSPQSPLKAYAALGQQPDPDLSGLVAALRPRAMRMAQEHLRSLREQPQISPPTLGA